MNLVKKVCEELGVEVGEKWKGNDGNTYKIAQDGRVFVRDYKWLDVDEWANIMSGHLRPEWRPEKGEVYYVPNIYDSEESMYTDYNWTNTHWENVWYNKGLVFKTKEEAQIVAQEMIILAKHGI